MINISKVAVVSALTVFSLWPQVVVAQARSGAAESCSELHRRYDFVDRMIAMKDAEGTADNSVPRATLRELEMLNERQRQLILLEFMQMRNCPAPERVGGSALYMLAAMECRLAMMRNDADRDAKCNLANWEPIAPSTSSETN